MQIGSGFLTWHAEMSPTHDALKAVDSLIDCISVQRNVCTPIDSSIGLFAECVRELRMLHFCRFLGLVHVIKLLENH